MAHTAIAFVRGHSDERPLALVIATAVSISCSPPTPLPAPLHKPTVLKVGSLAAATIIAPAPARRSQRKVETAEPRLAEAPRDEEEYAYLMQYCEACDGRKRRHTCGKKLCRGKWHQTMAALKAAEEETAALKAAEEKAAAADVGGEGAGHSCGAGGEGAGHCWPSPAASLPPLFQTSLWGGLSGFGGGLDGRGDHADISSDGCLSNSEALRGAAGGIGDGPGSGGAHASALGSAGGGSSLLAAAAAHGGAAVAASRRSFLNASCPEFTGPLLLPPLGGGGGGEFGFGLFVGGMAGGTDAGADDLLFPTGDLLADDY